MPTRVAMRFRITIPHTPHAPRVPLVPPRALPCLAHLAGEIVRRRFRRGRPRVGGRGGGGGHAPNRRLPSSSSRLQGACLVPLQLVNANIYIILSDARLAKCSPTEEPLVAYHPSATTRDYDKSPKLTPTTTTTTILFTPSLTPFLPHSL